MNNQVIPSYYRDYYFANEGTLNDIKMNRFEDKKIKVCSTFPGHQILDYDRCCMDYIYFILHISQSITT